MKQFFQQDLIIKMKIIKSLIKTELLSNLNVNHNSTETGNVNFDIKSPLEHQI